MSLWLLPASGSRFSFSVSFSSVSSATASSVSGSGRRMGSSIERSEPFAFRFETLYADETFRIDFLWVAETVVPAERDLQPWIGFIREQDEAAVLVFSHETLGLGTRFERKTLDVRITLLVGIVENGTPYLVR